MKPVIYHYVRRETAGLPYFPYLRLEDFRRQLDWFAAKYGFVSRAEFEHWVNGGEAPEGVLLTFDDGLRDHLDQVLPEILVRDIWGLFYVASVPLVEERYLDVHKVHLAVGRLGGKVALQWLEVNFPELVERGRTIDCGSGAYGDQRSSDATRFVKRLFNWQLLPEERQEALDRFFNFAFDGLPPLWNSFYMDTAGIRKLLDAGMGVGPHGHTHAVLSLLDEDRQKQEILQSCDVLESLGGNRSWGYCYAHGIRDAFSPASERIAAEVGCPFAFAMADQDVTKPLKQSDTFALPRHNCNRFPFGAVSYEATSE